MRRAWYVIDKEGKTFNDKPIGFIVSFTRTDFVWDIYLYNDNWVTYIDFDETNLDEKYLSVQDVDGVMTVIEDTAQKNADAIAKDENDAIQTQLLAMQNGKEVLALVGVIFNNLTVEDYMTLLADTEIKMIKDLLIQGALESAKGLLALYTPNAIVTQEIINRITAKIDSFIQQ